MMRGIAILYKHGTLRRSYNIACTANNVKQINKGSQYLTSRKLFSTNRDGDDDFDIPPLDLTKPSTSIPLPPNIIQQQEQEEKKQIINARGNLSIFSLSSSSPSSSPQSTELLSKTAFNIEHPVPKPSEELQHSIFNSRTSSTKYGIDKLQKQQLEHNGEGKLTSEQRGKIRKNMKDRLSSYDQRDKLATTWTDVKEVGTNLTEERREHLLLLQQEFRRDLMKKFPCQSSSIPLPRLTGSKLKAQSKLNNEIEEITTEILKSSTDAVTYGDPFECDNPLERLHKKVYAKMTGLHLLEVFGVTPSQRSKIRAKAVKLGLEYGSTERNLYIQQQLELKRQAWITHEEDNAPSKSLYGGINQMNAQLGSNTDADHQITEHDGIERLKQQLEFHGGKLSSKQRGKIRQKMRDWLLNDQSCEVSTSMNQLPNDDSVTDDEVSIEEGLLYDGNVPQDRTDRKKRLLSLKQQYQNKIKKRHCSSSLTPSPKITSGKRLKIQQKLNYEIRTTMKEMLKSNIDTVSFDSDNPLVRDDRLKGRLYRKLKELNNLEEFGVTPTRRLKIVDKANKLGLEKHSPERQSYLQQQLELERQAWINETKKINVPPPSKSAVQQPLEVFQPSPSLLQQIDDAGGIQCDLRPTNTLLEDENNSDEGSAYVIKNVASAPISSLFESYNVNKHSSNTRRSQQYNWRSSSSRKNKKRFTNVGDTNSDLQWHMTNKPSRVGNSSSPYEVTTAKNDGVSNVNNSKEKQESDGNSILSEIFPIKSAVTAVTSIFKQVTTAIGFTGTFDSNNIEEALNDKQVSEESKSSARKIRQYRCPDCNYQVKRWVVLKGKMRNCAHCSTTTEAILDSDYKGSAARNFEVHVDNNNDTNASIPLPGYRKRNQPWVDRRERNGFLLPPIYRMRNGLTVSSIQQRINDEKKRISMNSEKKRSKTSMGKKEKSSLSRPQ